MGSRLGNDLDSEQIRRKIMRKVLSAVLSVVAMLCFLIGLNLTTYTTRAVEAGDFIVAKSSIRLAPSEENGNGIRFAVLMKKTMYINYAKSGCELGALIIPTDLIPEAGLTADTENVQKIVTYGVNVDESSNTGSRWMDCDIEGYSDYKMSVVYLWGIPEGCYNRPVSVVGYAKNADGAYIYSSEMSKSLSDVALAEYKATGNEDMKEYLQNFVVEFYDADNQKITQDSYSYTFGDAFNVPNVPETKDGLVFDGWQEYIETVDSTDVYSEKIITDFSDKYVRYSTKYRAHYGRPSKTLTDGDVAGEGYVSDFDNVKLTVTDGEYVTSVPSEYGSSQKYFLDFVLDKSQGIYNIDLIGFDGISYKASDSYYNTITIKGYTSGDVSNWLLLPMKNGVQNVKAFSPVVTKEGNLTVIKYFFMAVPETDSLRIFSANGNAELFVTEVGYKAQGFVDTGVMDETATKIIVPQICNVDDFHYQAQSLFILDRGRVAVIDGGDSASEATKFILVNELRKLGVTKIDALILTHPHSDHTGAINTLIENFDIGAFYYKNADYRSKNNGGRVDGTSDEMATQLNEILECANAKINSDSSRVSLVDPTFGQTVTLTDNGGTNDGVFTFFFNQKVFSKTEPVDGNYFSMTMEYSIGGKGIIYVAGDLADEYTSYYGDFYDETVINSANKVAIWQINHHGSAGPYSSSLLIDRLRPEYAIGMGQVDNLKAEVRAKINQYAGNADIYYACYGAEFTVDVDTKKVTADESFTHENGDDNFRYVANVTSSDINERYGATVDINENNLDTTKNSYLNIEYVTTIDGVDESGSNRYLHATATAMPSALALNTFKNIFTIGKNYKLTMVMAKVTSTAKFHVLFQSASGSGLLSPKAFTVKAIDENWSEYSVAFEAVEGLSYLELFDYDNYQTTSIRTEFYLKSVNVRPAEEHEVTFYDADGSVISTKRVIEGSYLSVSDPSKEGYNFGGWDMPIDGEYTGLNLYSSNAVNKLEISADCQFKAVYYPAITASDVEDGYTLDLNSANLFTNGGYYNDLSYVTVSGERYLKVTKQADKSVSALALRSFNNVFTAGEKYELRIKATSSSSLGGIILQMNANGSGGSTADFSQITEGDYKTFVCRFTADSDLSFLLVFCNNTACDLEIKAVTVRKLIYATASAIDSEEGLTIRANNLAYDTKNYIETTFNGDHVSVAQNGVGADFRFASFSDVFTAGGNYVVTFKFRQPVTVGSTFLLLRMSANESNGNSSINKVTDTVYRSYFEGYDGMVYFEIFMAGSSYSSFEFESVNVKKVGSMTFTADEMTVGVNGSATATKGTFGKDDFSSLPEEGGTYYKVGVANASNVMFEDFRGLLRPSYGYTITIKAFVVGGTSKIKNMYLGTLGSSTNNNSMENPMMQLQSDGSYIITMTSVTASDEKVIGIFGTASETLYIEWIKVEFLGATTNVALTADGGTVDFTQNQSTTFTTGGDNDGNYKTTATIDYDANGTKALHVVRESVAGFYLAFTNIGITNGETYKFTFTAKGFNIDTAYLAGITGNKSGRASFEITAYDAGNAIFNYTVTFTASQETGDIKFYNSEAYSRDFYIYNISLEKAN